MQRSKNPKRQTDRQIYKHLFTIQVSLVNKILCGSGIFSNRGLLVEFQLQLTKKKVSLELFQIGMDEKLD